MLLSTSTWSIYIRKYGVCLCIYYILHIYWKSVSIYIWVRAAVPHGFFWASSVSLILCVYIQIISIWFFISVLFISNLQGLGIVLVNLVYV